MLVLLVFAGAARAVEGYGSASLGAAQFKIADTGYNLATLNVSGGAWLWQGIGVELAAGFSLDDDTNGSLTLDSARTVSINVRLESPRADGYSIYTLFGVSSAKVDTVFSNLSGSNTGNSLTGGRITVGATAALQRRLQLDLGFSHYEFEDNIRQDSLHFGLRYEFGAK